MWILIAFALAAQPTPYVLAPGSRLSIEGDSSLHRWSCAAKTIDAQVSVDLTDPTLTRALVVSIPVKGIDCGHAKMSSDLRDALAANRVPVITYRLVSVRRTNAQGVVLQATGELAIAGTTRTVTFDVAVAQEPTGALRATGSVPLRMSEFGIKPPTAMLGALKTRDAVTVKFDLRVAPAGPR